MAQSWSDCWTTGRQLYLYARCELSCCCCCSLTVFHAGATLPRRRERTTLLLGLSCHTCEVARQKSIFGHALQEMMLSEAFVSNRHFAPQNALLLGILCILILCIVILCSSEHFDPQHILIPGTPCLVKHFAPQHILLSGILCSLEHFAPWNILLLCKMFSAIYFALWNTKKQSVLGSKVFHQSNCAE